MAISTDAPAARPTANAPTRNGLRVARRWTQIGVDPLDQVAWDQRRTVITNPDGSVVFQMDTVEVPHGWSQLATDIVVSKYFRKAGLKNAAGHETSVRQVVHRIAHTIRVWGERQGGYFASAADAEAFEAELKYMLVHQIGAFNSPVWFNCGLHHEYGIEGSGGNFFWDEASAQVGTTADSYSRPQVSACFIQSIGDDLMSIFELARNEARVFKYGSGTGTNFSKLRGRMEKLSGGGTSSGLMSFLEVLDRGAGATKSGGTTRRAAKMVVLDVDHPEILDFVRWKVREEKKVAALVAAGYPSDFNGEAYATVSGQNSNNSVRVPDRFMKAVQTDGEWQTTFRTTGQVHETHKAREVWREISESAWACADPGVQYDDTIQNWHTCKATDRINATNPCVTGDTLIATSEGWQRIDSLVGKTPQVIGDDGELHPAAKVWKTGTKPVFLLRTEAGLELRLTGDHRVLTANRGDVAVRELLSNDMLRVSGAGFGDLKVKHELAYELGRAIALRCERAEALVGAAVGSNGHGAESVDGLPGVTQEELDGAIRDYLLLDAEGRACGLTPRVNQFDRESVVNLLRGLFSLDPANFDLRRGFRAERRELLSQVQLLLLNFGVLTSVNEDFEAETADGAIVFRRRNGSRLSVSRNSKNWYSGIPFLHQIKPRDEQPESGATFGNTIPLPRLSVWSDQLASIEPLGEEDVFDLTEPATSHFVANGIVVHNCSEFVFLDDTACNLASINLMKFLQADGGFDVESYRHANRVFFLAQEILVGFASYPTERIAQRSHEYRPLGLGYANLGTLLMMQGLPYDSDAARAWASSITALMTGEAYAMSAEMAASVGPFTGYEPNRDSMLAVMHMHRDAARAIDANLPPRNLRDSAIESWDRAVTLGTQHGYRNSQATVLAPTGTIGLLMDCDTTGVEPDFALVKFKKLAGGGYFKIVNQSVPEALRRLGYDHGAIERIVKYAIGTGTFEGAPHINHETLTTKGLTDSEIARLEQALPNVLDVRFAFVRGQLTDDTLSRLGVSQQERSRAGWNALGYLGFTDAQIDAANAVICGSQCVEGAPGLRPEHLPVFDCANRCGPAGTRYIEPMGHVRMMAAAQPFISGAISKTVNLPHDAGVEDVQRIYDEGWKLGLKAIALYRDGCKLSQPLATGRKATDSASDTAKMSREGIEDPSAAPPKLRRRRLPKRRHGFTQEARIAGHKVFVRTGEYEDGTLGEIFIDMHKEGAAFRSMMNCFAISVSMGLQYGVPLEDLVDQFVFTRFEPQGRVEGHDNLKASTSVIDYVFRVLGIEYCNRYDLAHIVTENMQGQPKGQGHPPVGREHQIDGLLHEDTSMSMMPSSAGENRISRAVSSNSIEAQTSKFSGDAPLCNLCGHITLRNGTCYKCLNCGNSLGCS
ncbi:MAG: vitamin B12-dependent ribonucleotide reductase [Candidatus Eisenbacteria bacterium]|uniref:Vitamin B12-dependent ribonucleotide reductase n=1 Tax=Eiseniibacteriota bacterium TaxID=2212470 RepID=A0A849T0M7_UNCEI|nr:vitamin B12-dependent ribonucleotide reductase [Candidatus Eisenbacteria bacterium]